VVDAVVALDLPGVAPVDGEWPIARGAVEKAQLAEGALARAVPRPAHADLDLRNGVVIRAVLLVPCGSI
jgi:hypothetical protein